MYYIHTILKFSDEKKKKKEWKKDYQRENILVLS